MKKRTLFIPLILIVAFLFCSGAYAADVNQTVDVDMSEISANHFYYDGKACHSGDTVYHRFTVSQPSLVRMYGDTYNNAGEYLDSRMYGSFSLCDANKNKLLDINDYYTHDSDTAYSCFVLRPGTYFLKDECTAPYTIHLECKKSKRKVASKKKKAVNIKRGKKVSGFFYSGEGNSHWYKLKLTKKQKVKFTFEGYGTDTLYFYIYGKGKNNSTYTYCYDSKSEGTYQSILGGKVPKGTYYVKVTRKSNDVSGQYTIRWK